MGQIIDARRSRDFIAYATPVLVQGREISDVCYQAGTYGMGGYGFFGLRLAATATRSAEWLVCTIFGADNWLTVGERWLGTHPAQYAIQRPLQGYEYRTDERGQALATGDRWDDFQPLVMQQRLTHFHCERHACALHIGTIVLEIHADASRRPIFCGNQQPRRLAEDDDLQHGWIMARSTKLFL